MCCAWSKQGAWKYTSSFWRSKCIVPVLSVNTKTRKVMYTTNVFRHVLWGALVLGVSQAQGQVSVPGHLGGPGDHLGWNAFTPQALEVRHDGNWPIQWYTDAIQRMMLNPTVSTGINGFAAAPRDGFLLLSCCIRE